MRQRALAAPGLGHPRTSIPISQGVRTYGAQSVRRIRQGARPVGDRRRRRAGWLWPLLALLALLLLIGLIVALVGGDDDGGGGNAQTQRQGGQGIGLSAAGQSLSPTTIKNQIGQDASGKNLVVQSVVEGEGFWVGTSQTDRLYIEYGGAAGKIEEGFRPDRAGRRVTLDGPVRPAPSDPVQTLKLPAADAEVVEQQGAYINANSVQPAG